MWSFYKVLKVLAFLNECSSRFKVGLKDLSLVGQYGYFLAAFWKQVKSVIELSFNCNRRRQFGMAPSFAKGVGCLVTIIITIIILPCRPAVATSLLQPSFDRCKAVGWIDRLGNMDSRNVEKMWNNCVVEEAEFFLQRVMMSNEFMTEHCRFYGRQFLWIDLFYVHTAIQQFRSYQWIESSIS